MAFRSRAGIVGIALVVAGCRSQPTGERAATLDPPREPPRAAEVAPATSTIARVSHERFAETTAPDTPDAKSADSLSGANELSLETLITAVEERNPSLQSMVAAWQAAAQRCPQVVALDDPMFQTMVCAGVIRLFDRRAGIYDSGFPKTALVRQARAARPSGPGRGERCLL